MADEPVSRILKIALQARKLLIIDISDIEKCSPKSNLR